MSQDNPVSQDILEFLRSPGEFAQKIEPESKDLFLVGLHWAKSRLEQEGLGILETQQEAWETLAENRIALMLGPPGTGKTHMLAWMAVGFIAAHNEAGKPCRVFVSGFTKSSIINLLEVVCGIKDAVFQSLSVEFIGQSELAPPGLANWNKLENLQERQRAWRTFSARSLLVGGTVWSLLKVMETELPSGQFTHPTFDLVLIDEASQLLLSHGLVALAGLAENARVIVAGDDRQLAPIRSVELSEQAEGIYGGSLYSFLKRRGAPECALKVTFRLNAPLAEFPARRFYNDEYESFFPRRRLELPPDWRKQLEHAPEWVVQALDPELPLTILLYDGPAYGNDNPFERDLIETLCSWSLPVLRDGDEFALEGDEVWSERLAIVSPHRVQNAHLRESLTRSTKTDVFVDTIDRIQGRQRDMIVYSFTVSDPEFGMGEAGFLFDSKRFNVATTRARSKVVLIISRGALEVVPTHEELFDAVDLVREYVFDTQEICSTTIEHENNAIELQVRGKRFSEASLPSAPVTHIDPPTHWEGTFSSLLEALRSGSLGSIKLSELAGEFETTTRVVREWVSDNEHLQVFRQENTGGQRWGVVAPSLTPETLEQMLPVPLQPLEETYAAVGERENFSRLLLTAEEDGVLSINLQTQELEAYRSVAFPGPPEGLEVKDLQVLNALEDIEAGRINSGQFETAVEALQVSERLGEGWSTSSVNAALRRLEGGSFVLALRNERWRSRISEIVRLVRYVKQRFHPDYSQSPYLVQSLRVHFENRRRLDFAHKAKPVFEAASRRAGQEKSVARALEVVLAAFANAVSVPVEQCRLTGVQARSFELLSRDYLEGTGGGAVVTGNTGSGKTEASLLPLLVGAIADRLGESGFTDGCKLILVYPRQTLIRNQLGRLCDYLAEIEKCVGKDRDARLSVGIAFGDTPQDDSELLQGSDYSTSWSQDDGRIILPHYRRSGAPIIATASAVDGYYTLKSEDGEWALGKSSKPLFAATREAIKTNPPDVLLITTEMLHRWLMDRSYNRLFGIPDAYGGLKDTTAPRAVVFDEIHLYDGIHGAQVGLLLRRLRHRLRCGLALEGGREDPLMIGMSATIASPKSFWAELSGVDGAQLECIEPQEEDFGEEQGRDYYLFVRPETYSRGKRVGNASAAIQTIMAIAHNMMRRVSKHRTLVFQDSISKVRKLAVEYQDAERQRLAALRMRPAGVDSRTHVDGEYWHFAATDTAQHSQEPSARLSTAGEPVFSGSGRVNHILEKDVIFATSSLEVGYDDPSIQFVLQHHAPRNQASFVQKKGRAGRSGSDRPITAVTLSRGRYLDSFYFQNPQRLYDPTDYRPGLNINNYFVQTFQSLALLFDELARCGDRDYGYIPHVQNQSQMRDMVEDALQHIARKMRDGGFKRRTKAAFDFVTSASFRRVMPHWLLVWSDFTTDIDTLLQNEEHLWGRNLLGLSPNIPQNLFSPVNLPTVRVFYAQSQKAGGDKWDGEDVDISLALAEVAPGSVTRRWGRGGLMHWRPPTALIPGRGVVSGVFAFERYRENSDSKGFTFNPELIKDWSDLENTGRWLVHAPQGAQGFWDGVLPKRFYRLREMQLFSFGTVDYNNPRRPNRDWTWFGRKTSTSGVEFKFFKDQVPPVDERWRHVSSESSSYPLSFAVALPNHKPQCSSRLAPLFSGLLEDVEFYFGEVEGERSYLSAHEVHYGSEATIHLVPKGRHDPHGGTVHMNVRYVSEHDGEPLLYGFDLDTEGIRVPYSERRLREVAEAVWEVVCEDESAKRHIQDQFLRFLMKSGGWVKTNADDGVSRFGLSIATDVFCTMRAETRGSGLNELDEFFALVRDENTRIPDSPEQRQVQGWAMPYWGTDRRLLGDFWSRFHHTFSDSESADALGEILRKITHLPSIVEFVADVILHSLEHALFNLVLLLGGVPEQELSRFTKLSMSHDERSNEEAFYIFERNRDGNGATRILCEQLEHPEHFVSDWISTALTCPVADEEAYIRAMLQRYGDELAMERDEDELDSYLRECERSVVHGQAEDHHRARLVGLVNASFSFGGEQVSLLSLTLELMSLEQELASRFDRPPTSEELAHFALHEVTANNRRSLASLSKMRGILLDHTETLSRDGIDDEVLDPDERFVNQVIHIGPWSCREGCPACLMNGRSDVGRPEIAKHTLLRSLLREAHLHIAGEMWVDYGTPPSALHEVAERFNGLVFLKRAHPSSAGYETSLSQKGFRKQGTQTIWRAGGFIIYDCFCLKPEE